MNANFSARLKQKRNEMGLTQKRLGLLIGVETNTIYKWEKGMIVPSMDSLQKVSAALNTSVGYLIGEKEELNINMNAVDHSNVGTIKNVGGNTTEVINPPPEPAIIVEHEDGGNKTRVSLPPNTSADVVARVLQELKGK